MATREYRIKGQKKRVRCALVLLRHGQSLYNQEKLFTGWADPDLTNRGREEARLAGQLLKATGIERIEAYLRLLLFRHLDLLRRGRRLREPPEDVDVLNAERNPKNPK